ncbi:dihydroorotate dehydrogenase [Microbacterium protaetiae]|uniref:Dihydroorotate dehydrogenase n=1 Tax=Microbacterium protaetiae TaxID=2509458 RepID=A0A4P6E950_9MICO|nr:dihydroorotate dehydrogenase [Microbacterium protaetiae]QAY58565.1 dihydroorotate dehydrogenase [Microbacterium protaetiae]
MSTTVRAVTTATRLPVQIGSLRLENPVMPASGCFGPELARLGSLAGIGATVTKTVFLDERGGNSPNRITEGPSGMFNSVGIPSTGPRGYLETLHPRYREIGVPVITSVGAHTTAGYAHVLEMLGDAADAYELNVSCPNLDKHGVEIGADPVAIEEAVALACVATDRPLIVKLSPLVSSIGDCARAAQNGGAAAVCVSNSVPVLPVDPRSMNPALGNMIGGLSGPRIRPIILRLVWLVSQAIQIPVIGCGGIESASDALEYISVGASAVQVGTAGFSHPRALARIAADLVRLADEHGTTSLREVVAQLQRSTK